MKFTDYIIDRAFAVTMFLAAVIFSAGFLWLMGLRCEFIIYIEMIFGFSFLAAFVWDYTRKKNYYREYIEMWVHEIKTPITSAHLIIENDKNSSTVRIDDEPQSIDHFVEQALFYARSTALEKDFKIEKTTMKTLVWEALKSYSGQIIGVGGRPVFENLDIPVFADGRAGFPFLPYAFGYAGGVEPGVFRNHPSGHARCFYRQLLPPHPLYQGRKSFQRDSPRGKIPERFF